jgi:myo-inositol-1-phosphate synthase
MSKEIRIAIVGIGNCASALIQGLFYYKDVKDERELSSWINAQCFGRIQNF